MLNRETALASLLNSAGWSNAERAPLAGDASSRSYERLTRKGSGAVCILMNAPPESCGPVDPFLAVTGFLRGRGYSAPAIIAADRVAGYLLLEDLGDALYAHSLADRPQEECKLYDAAIDLLAELRETPPPDCFPLYSPEEQADLAALAPRLVPSLFSSRTGARRCCRQVSRNSSRFDRRPRRPCGVPAPRLPCRKPYLAARTPGHAPRRPD